MRYVSEKSTSNIKMANNSKSLKITESKENKRLNGSGEGGGEGAAVPLVEEETLAIEQTRLR